MKLTINLEHELRGMPPGQWNVTIDVGDKIINTMSGMTHVVTATNENEIILGDFGSFDLEEIEFALVTGWFVIDKKSYWSE